MPESRVTGGLIGIPAKCWIMEAEVKKLYVPLQDMEAEILRNMEYATDEQYDEIVRLVNQAFDRGCNHEAKRASA